MREAEIHEQSRLLWSLHGAKAIALAAHKASDLEKRGEADQAQLWRRVEAALMLRRGPHQS
jgi:hypothetical protein